MVPTIMFGVAARLEPLTEEELKRVTGGTWWSDYYGEDGYYRGKE